MKQILQNLKTGSLELAEIPCPRAGAGQVLIRTTHSLISAGTERMLVDFGKASLIDKARQQPDKVKMVLDKIRTDGLISTIEAVRHKLDQPLSMGYCNVGRVIELGASAKGFELGDRVASNGKHAEMVSVPMRLCVKIPDGVTDEQAAFTVVGAIALQGIRLAEPTLGETVVVTGLGLIGLLTVQLLHAQGCRVLGIDFDPFKLELARNFGAEVVNLSTSKDPIAHAECFSRERGVDAVIVTAATKSNEPVHQAAIMCRKRGRIVLVGVTGLELSRTDFYEKELKFQVSCSYGPGRYDPAYEERGQDYPIGFVRWTAQRNFEAVLDMISDGRLDVRPLISHRFKLEEMEKAYSVITGNESSLGVLLTYPTAEKKVDAIIRKRNVCFVPPSPKRGKEIKAPTVAFIGAGNYATAVLIPAFKSAGVRLKSVASKSGVNGVHACRKFGFEETTTDAESLFFDSQVDAVVITTPHDGHAHFIVQALKAGKHVFVEKPLCLTLKELAMIETAYSELAKEGKASLMMVGFNRRFAPHVQKIKTLLVGIKVPKSFVMTVNAGKIPASHWTQDSLVGGGRIIGEACHFIDLLRYLADSPIVSSTRVAMNDNQNDTVSLQLNFADGSIGTVHYFSNGSKALPKERLEVFAGGGVLQLNNFRMLRGFGWPKFKSMRLWRQDKGQTACAAAFVQAIHMGGGAPIPFQEIVEVSRKTIELA